MHVSRDFELLLADTSDLVFDLSAAGLILAANRAATRATGLPSEQLAELPFSQLVAPEFQAVFEYALRTAPLEGECPASELHLLCGNSRLALSARIRRLPEGDGRAFRLVAQDQTAVHEAQLHVRQMEERFRAAVQTSPDAVAINRLTDGIYVEINEGFTAITGYTREDLLGRSSLELGIWTQPEERQAIVQRLLSEGSVQNFEAHFRRKSGRIETGLMSARIVMLNGEKHILSVTRDMTAWRLAESALHEREASLEAAQQLSRTLLAAIEQAAEDITITDTEGRIQYANPSFERITGFQPSEVVGHTPNFLKSGHHDRAFYEDLWQTVRAGRTWQGRFFNRRRDGEIVVEDSIISPIFTPSSEPLGYVAVKRDVTAQLELEEKFHQAQKLESVGRLAGGVAHDFNNLLTVINGYCHLLLHRIGPGQPFRNEIEMILNAGERAAGLTAQLLAFSRKQVVAPKLLDLGSVVKDAEKMLRRMLGEDVGLDVNAAGAPVHILADAGQIHQVLMNLAVNARDAMPGGGRLTIEVSGAELAADSAATPAGLVPGPYALLRIADTGEGMLPQVREHIFEPFFTTKEQGKGTGLGLSTVYGIVQQCGGGIAVATEPGEGATFLLYFPRVAAGGACEAGPAAADVASGSETILVVEDQEEVRRMTIMVLRGYGYRVLEAADGASALALAVRHEGPIHLVVTDVVMPALGGIELAERLKPLRPDSKILFTSGYWEDATTRRGALPQGCHYLPKPFTPTELATKVRAILTHTPAATID